MPANPDYKDLLRLFGEERVEYPIHIIGRDALLQAKAASGRPQDLLDIDSLKRHIAN